MHILKFGGTSVGSPGRMRHVAALITADDRPKIVVLSAVSGTTNKLVAIWEKAKQGAINECLDAIATLKEEYRAFIKELLPEPGYTPLGHAIIDEQFAAMKEAIEQQPKSAEKTILAQGELLSTRLFCTFLQMEGKAATLLPALEFMRLDENDEPDVGAIASGLDKLLKGHKGDSLFVTQGYICRNSDGAIDNLKRGGSDYTASLIGAAAKAREVQIWTDIDGMHNNDPRVVKNTFPIAELSFEEAAELAYFGAKILHPSSIWPAQQYNIPVRLLNTMQPEARGTLISNVENKTGDIKAIAAKDGITAIKIKSTRMLLAYGFLRRIFEVFEQFKTPIDMITTSEVAVSLTIDDTSKLSAINEELSPFGKIIIDYDQTIICIVGDMVADRKGIVNKIFQALGNVPVRMISYGGSKNNISILIDSVHKTEALEALNEKLFVVAASISK